MTHCKRYNGILSTRIPGLLSGWLTFGRETSFVADGGSSIGRHGESEKNATNSEVEEGLHSV